MFAEATERHTIMTASCEQIAVRQAIRVSTRSKMQNANIIETIYDHLNLIPLSTLFL